MFLNNVVELCLRGVKSEEVQTALYEVADSWWTRRLVNKHVRGRDCGEKLEARFKSQLKKRVERLLDTYPLSDTMCRGHIEYEGYRTALENLDYFQQILSVADNTPCSLDLSETSSTPPITKLLQCSLINAVQAGYHGIEFRRDDDEVTFDGITRDGTRQLMHSTPSRLYDDLIAIIKAKSGMRILPVTEPTEGIVKLTFLNAPYVFSARVEPAQSYEKATLMRLVSTLTTADIP